MREKKVGKGVPLAKPAKVARRKDSRVSVGGKRAAVESSIGGGLPVPRNDATDGAGVERPAVLPSPERVESVPTIPQEPKRVGPRPGFITERNYVHTSSPWCVFRHRTSRAGTQKTKNAHITLPYSMAAKIVEERKKLETWLDRCVESIEDYQALMSNPQWMIDDREKQIEKIMSLLQSRLTNLKRLNK